MSEHISDVIKDVQQNDSALEKMVREIIDTDNAARKTVAGAKERRDGVAAEITRRKKELREKYSSDSAEQIALAEAQANEKAERDTAGRIASFEQAAKELETAFDNNRDRWIDEIVANVTSV